MPCLVWRNSSSLWATTRSNENTDAGVKNSKIYLYVYQYIFLYIYYILLSRKVNSKNFWYSFLFGSFIQFLYFRFLYQIYSRMNFSIHLTNLLNMTSNISASFVNKLKHLWIAILLWDFFHRFYILYRIVW